MLQKHNHSHNHSNSDTLANTRNYNKAFGFGIALNIIYIVVEVTFGLIINLSCEICDNKKPHLWIKKIYNISCIV